MSIRYKAKRRERYWANAWRCPWCSGCNRRDFEGLDRCDRCGSHTHTQYDFARKNGRLMVMQSEEPETFDIGPCWCGELRPHYAPLTRRCGGSRIVNCLCGGDFCVCHNHGESECFGCEDCESPDRDEFEEYSVDDFDE